jgi:2-C-methyl-D-erythritol 4-phosphate cytidylyltransferase
LVLITLQPFLRLPEVREIIIAVHPRHLQPASRLIRNKIKGKVIKLVVGGRHRSDSVANALKIIEPKSRFILIHDAARPLVSLKLIRRVIRASRKYGAAVPALPVTDTIKRVNLHLNRVKETIKPRRELYLIQTPQGFQREIILKAYNQRAITLKQQVTDDASLIERLGYPVKIVAGDPRNIKLTTPLDKIIIGSLLSLQVQKLLTSP